MFAQSVLEYGSITQELSTGIVRLTRSVEHWVRTATPTTWLVIGAAVVVGFMLLRRR